MCPGVSSTVLPLPVTLLTLEPSVPWVAMGSPWTFAGSGCLCTDAAATIVSQHRQAVDSGHSPPPCLACSSPLPGSASPQPYAAGNRLAGSEGLHPAGTPCLWEVGSHGGSFPAAWSGVFSNPTGVTLMMGEDPTGRLALPWLTCWPPRGQMPVKSSG